MIKTQLLLTPDAKKFKTEPCAEVSYSIEEDYVDDSKSILDEMKRKIL